MGDLNLNLMDSDCYSLTGEFLDEMYSNMFFPLITHPTRITSHTATLIDNIFTNHFHHHLKSGLLFTDISDHLPVFSICFDQTRSCQKTNDLITFRDKNKNNIIKFKEQLGSINWSELDGYHDPQNSYKSFLSKFTDIYNICFPLKKTKVKHHLIGKPWLSKRLLKSIKRKNKLYKQYLYKPTSEHEICYKRYKNKLNHSLRIAKSYYAKKLENIKQDTSRTKLPSTFKVDDNTDISDPVEIANRFCRL